MKIQRVEVMEVSDDKGTIQFRKNDVVEILYEINGISEKCLGRIAFIYLKDFEIDASKEYKSDIKNIRYKDIKSIKLIKRE